MSAEELFRSGRLAEAIAEQTTVVKKSPVDADARYLLFVLLAFAGELERADKQLDVLADRDEQTRAGTLVYHSLLGAEWERRKVFEEHSRPILPPDAPEYASLRLAALEKLREGDTEAAEAEIVRAEECTPDLSGKLNGEGFDGLRDYDDLLGTVLEIFAGGRYIWLPMTRVRSLSVGEPATALDALWLPATLEDSDGTLADVHLPVLYQPSYRHDHEAIRLGRVTDWVERGELFTGVGQHLLLAIRGGERYEESILDLRHLEIERAG
jgi:type VI secretion system protein ImpE